MLEAKVPGWQLQLNETSMKIKFSLQQIKIKVAAGNLCNLGAQWFNIPLICAYIFNEEGNLGPVNNIYGNYD